MSNYDQMSIHPETVPISGINPFFPYVSTPRQVMMGGNLTQTNVVDGATRKRARTGFEREHAKGTFKHMFDTDVLILDVIPRFTKKHLLVPGAQNPMDVVIFEDFHTKQLNCVELKKFHIMHQHYGFNYRFNEDVMDSLQPRARFPKGTVIANSPNVTSDGDYMIGLETNVAFLTDPALSEDGVVISKSYAKRISTHGFETRTFTCGRTHYPINWNGNSSKYKAIPDIGEKIRSNGLIAAFRPFDQMLDSVYMTGKHLMTPVFGMDVTLYGIANAKVVDIRVLHNERLEEHGLPSEFTDQLRHYYEADKEFYMRIIKATLNRTGSRLSDTTNLHPNLWRLILEGISYCGTDLVKEGLWDASDIERLRTPRGYRGEPLDEWRVDITFEYTTEVAEGPKVTNLHGSRTFH